MATGTLTSSQQTAINAYKDAYSKAQARGDTQAMAAAHTGAESIRASAGFSGGADGSKVIALSQPTTTAKPTTSTSSAPVKTTSTGYSAPIGPTLQANSYTPNATNSIPTAQPTTNTSTKLVAPVTNATKTPTVSTAPSMSASDIAQINIWKEHYNTAIANGNKQAADYAHQQAEAIRAKYGISGGADGSQSIALANPVTQTDTTKKDNYIPPTVSEADQKQLDLNSKLWQQATDAGNTELAKQINANSNAIRAKYGFTGGADGATYSQVKETSLAANSVQNGVNSADQTNYKSYYDAKIKEAIDSIINGKEFKYDPNSDSNLSAAQQQAASAIQREMAKRGMDYSTFSASQMIQAQQNLIPQYEQMAYGRYQDNLANQYNKANTMNTIDQVGYQRYRDLVGDEMAKYGTELNDQTRSAITAWNNLDSATKQTLSSLYSNNWAGGINALVQQGADPTIIKAMYGARAMKILTDPELSSKYAGEYGLSTPNFTKSSIQVQSGNKQLATQDLQNTQIGIQNRILELQAMYTEPKIQEELEILKAQRWGTNLDNEIKEIQKTHLPEKIQLELAGMAAQTALQEAQTAKLQST